MACATQKEISNAELSRYHQRQMDSAGATWDLRIILDGLGEEIHIATLGKFKRRAHLRPDVRRRVIAAARHALRGGC